MRWIAEHVSGVEYDFVLVLPSFSGFASLLIKKKKVCAAA